MKDLNEATERICELFGSVLALRCTLSAVCFAMDDDSAAKVRTYLDRESEVCRTLLIPAAVSDLVINKFDSDISEVRASLDR